MSEWQAMAVFANFRLGDPIECKFASIVSHDDPRLMPLFAESKDLETFLSRFTDPFGRKVEPSVLIIPKDTPDSFRRTDALASLRDTLAVSVVPFNRALEIRYRDGHRALWSDYFSVYPWMVAKDGNGLIGSSPGLLGFDEVDDFRGQCAQALPRRLIAPHEFDRPLLAALLERWSNRYSNSAPAWAEIALFRSLNMAFNAAGIPSGTEVTYYDVGRQIALWVSAFEILVHSGVGGYANLNKVYELLEKASYDFEKSKEVTHICYKPGPKQYTSTNACWLYGLLYQARNDFLHGNPVEVANLKLPDGRNLFEFAAPLFRVARAAVFALTFIIF